MATKALNYELMYKELEEIVVSLQSSDIDLDSAVKKYERGMALVADLEKYLKEAQNKITKVKAASKTN